jgi:hypothetical protein
MITNTTPIDETGAVYRSSEMIAFGSNPPIYYDVEVTVFLTGDAHAIVNGKIDELYFTGDIELDDVISLSWDYAMDWAYDLFKETK